MVSPRTNSGAIQGGRRRRGVTVLEFAVVLPLLMMLLLGVWEAGRMLEVQQIMNNAAREGARQSASAQKSTSEVQTIVINYLKAAGITVSATDPNQVVTIKNSGFSGNPTPPDDNPLNAYNLDQLEVTVKIPLSDVRWVASNFVADPNTTLSSKAVWNSIKDKPYPAVNYPDPE